MATEKHIVVVGAGIVGASIAWHLVAAGARVTVVDAGAAGGVATAEFLRLDQRQLGQSRALFPPAHPRDGGVAPACGGAA